MSFYDTIAALSTPAGKGGVAVIRITGGEALAVAEKVFLAKNGKRVSELTANVMTYGEIKSGEDTVDDGMAVVFRAPRSFTGEDTVEINCHGGVYVTQKVLSAVFAAGARPAEAGEFTRRAFVNGKMGLSQAEALGSLLENLAPTGFALLLAGGIFYTVGIVFYAMKKVKYMHSVWHLFVLCGSVLQFFSVYFHVL